MLADSLDQAIPRRRFLTKYGLLYVVATAVVDGHLVAVGRSKEGAVRVWDLTTGKQIGEELVFPSQVHAVTVTPDGRLVVGFGWEIAVLARR